MWHVWRNGTQTVLAAKFDGKRFNSPNDLAIRKSGDVYFTDPPYGFANFNDSPLKELPHNGVYCVDPRGEVTLLISDLTWPNGIAFSPDEKTLYVAVSDPSDPRIMAYEVQSDGTVANGRTFFDAKPLLGQGRPGTCEGLKVDAQGNVWHRSWRRPGDQSCRQTPRFNSHKQGYWQLLLGRRRRHSLYCRAQVPYARKDGHQGRWMAIRPMVRTRRRLHRRLHQPRSPPTTRGQ